MIDGNRDISAASSRLIEAIEDTLSEFRTIFERDPLPKESLMMMTKYVHSARDRSLKKREMFESAGIEDRGLLYAWEKTGLVLTESNADLIPDIEIKEYQDEYDEYHAIKKEGIDPFLLLDRWSPHEFELIISCQDLLEQAIIHIGSFAEKSQHFCPLNEARFSYLYFLTRIFNLTKYIKSISEDLYAHDAIAFSRCIYENYLRVRCLRFSWRHGKKFVAASSVPFRQLAEITKTSSDVSIYTQLYPYLSGVTHTDFRDVNAYFSFEDGFFAERHNSVLVLVYITVCLLSLIFAEISLHRNAPSIARRDAAVIARRMSRWAYKANSVYSDLNLLSNFPSLKQRLGLIRRGEFVRL
jgi:hypothetical protein